MMGNGVMDKKTVKENIYVQMGIRIQDHLKMIIWTEMDHFFLKMVINILVFGNKEEKMEKEFILGIMETSMKESIRIMLDLDLEHLFKKMDIDMKEIGKMENNLEEESLCFKTEKNMMVKSLKEKHLMRFLYYMELLNSWN